MDTWTDYCPYCGEPIELLLDVSEGDQSYVEDCSVCCRPIEVSVQISPLQVWLRHENET